MRCWLRLSRLGGEVISTDRIAWVFRSATAVVYLLAAGGAKDVLDREKLEALYRAPVERLVDPETGVAFLPG